MPELVLEKVVAEIRNSQSALVLGHISPDPDAVGSSGALVHAMRENGKNADLYFYDVVPSHIKPLLGSLNALNDVPSRNYDLLIILDTATRYRAGKTIEQLQNLARLSVNIDHHISNDAWADINWIDGNSAASSEMVYDLLVALEWSLSPAVSKLLYAGILDDTGSFRYSNTSPHALHAASQLVERGANPAEIANLLYFSTPERVIKLRAESCRNLELHFGGRFSTLFVTQKMLEQTGCTLEDTEALVDLVRSIEGVEACALLRESEINWKLSLRSKSAEIDVNHIAQIFNGGGHKAAAGCKITGTLEEVKSKIVGEFSKIFITD